MSNTPNENLLAQSAFKAIAGRYGKYLNMNPSVKGFCQAMLLGQNIELYVKFMDNDPFSSNYHATGGSNRMANCAVCGFTAPKLTNKYDREMYINRQFANASTLVHEMLHFLTHPLFWNYVGPVLTESVTEYFTRKVVSHSSDFDISERKGRYDLHHTYLNLQRDAVKDKPQKGYMKAAYFQGDIKSISFIKSSFEDIEKLLAQDDS